MTDESRPYQPHRAPVAMSQVERQDELTIGSMCSGYGGLEMGLQAVVGGTVLWHSEVDPQPAKVLAVRYPGVPNLGDITTVNWLDDGLDYGDGIARSLHVDWLCAGYPCQPFSIAGRKQGAADERHLWPVVANAIGVLRPRRVLLENVAHHVAMGLDAVLWDLAALGYDATWGVVRAADAGAPHNRARLFILATDTRSVGRGPGTGLRESQPRGIGWGRPHHDDGEATADATGHGWDQGWAESTGQLGRPDVAERSAGAVADPEGAGPQRGGGVGGDSGESEGSPGRGGDPVAWGEFERAIDRWASVLGRAAPRPTERGRTGERLSPGFVEWMMGLPPGWVTEVAIPRNAQLKALGNGVVPQQAALAVRTLLSLEGEVAA